ncbi:MAG: SAM-dependent methyltransferase [Pseudomonadales bacterium]|jgi:SAM-dependent methyltransferase|nr:SAM-dependent methyltransferase [Pseudomonadales bacterium]
MKPILDACCGGRMFWFDKKNPHAVFGDLRQFETQLCDNRTFVIKPDVILDFTNLPYEDGLFKLVVFDPPHLTKIGDKSWMAIKYGKLDEDWRETLKKGFDECFRVLDKHGVLIFKWCERDIKLSEISDLFPAPPLFGHPTNIKKTTHWLCFMKGL